MTVSIRGILVPTFGESCHEERHFVCIQATKLDGIKMCVVSGAFVVLEKNGFGRSVTAAVAMDGYNPPRAFSTERDCFGVKPIKF